MYVIRLIDCQFQVLHNQLILRVLMARSFLIIEDKHYATR